MAFDPSERTTFAPSEQVAHERTTYAPSELVAPERTTYALFELVAQSAPLMLYPSWSPQSASGPLLLTTVHLTKMLSLSTVMTQRLHLAMITRFLQHHFVLS
jgi:hypothetical protein